MDSGQRDVMRQPLQRELDTQEHLTPRDIALTPIRDSSSVDAREVDGRVPILRESSSSNALEIWRPSVECLDNRVKVRWRALDALRGLVVALMLFVDLNGVNFPAIGHADWDGCHLADVVMPCFLFVTGVTSTWTSREAIELSVPTRKKSMWSMTIRCLKLFLLGFLLQNHGVKEDQYSVFDKVDLGTCRIMGILQRIALCSWIAHFISKWPAQNVGQYGTVSLPRVLFAYILHIGLAAFSVIVYIFLVYKVQVPKCDASQVTKDCNSLSYLDEKVLGRDHMIWNFTNATTSYFDPEGLVSTSGCVSTVFVGMLVGRVWSLTHFPMLDTFILGSVLVVTGVCLATITKIPFNKNVWSVSYNSVCTGANCFVLAILNYLVEKVRVSGLVLKPLQWIGANALFFFVFSSCNGVLRNILRHFYIHDESANLYDWFIDEFLKNDLNLQPQYAVLVYSIIEFVFFVAICGILYRKKMFWTL